MTLFLGATLLREKVSRTDIIIMIIGFSAAILISCGAFFDGASELKTKSNDNKPTVDHFTALSFSCLLATPALTAF